jgi:hypothetical protein
MGQKKRKPIDTWGMAMGFFMSKLMALPSSVIIRLQKAADRGHTPRHGLLDPRQVAPRFRAFSAEMRPTKH